MTTLLEQTATGPHQGVIAGAGLMAASLATVTSNGLLPDFTRTSVHVGTGWVVDGAPAVRDVVPPPAVVVPGDRVHSSASLLESLHSLSGLTWEQIARLFNVSRRSVHLWLAGGRLSAANEERLIDLEATLSSWDATPEERRHRLFQAPDGDRSLFDHARGANASRGDDINRPPEPLPESL